MKVLSSGWVVISMKIIFYNKKPGDKMKLQNTIMYVFLLSTLLSVPIFSQSEQGYILGIKNFEKSFPKDHNKWDSYENLYLDTHLDGQLTSPKLGLTTNDIFGKEMIYRYGNFDIHLVITSDSTLYLKNNKTGQDANEKMSTIHIDENTMLASFVDTENNLVTMLSDFENGKASAFLYKDDGSVTTVSGSIKLKK